MKTKETTYSNFGKTLYISNDNFELHVTLDFGPRIIHFSRKNMENMFYNDLEHKTLGAKQKEFNDIIKLYGGHRLWMSPEIMPDCYYPDNKPVNYEIENNIIRLLPAVEEYTNLQKIITLTINNDNIHLDHEITNCSDSQKEISSWAITMLDVWGIQILPAPNRKTGYLHNKNFSFWDYSKLDDARLKLGEKYIRLTNNPNNPNNFKMGYNNEDGYAIYFNKGQAFVKKFDFDIGGKYPDGGCNFETYNCSYMLEMETLSPLKILEPFQSVSHSETWYIYEAAISIAKSDEELDKFIEKYKI